MRECNAIILAGGFGSRLKSITGDNIPKPMARINGMPVIEHQVLQCKNYGFSKILILLHHLPQIIIDYLGDGSKYGVQIEYVIEAEPRGTAGAVLDALDFLAETFLVIYGDTFFDVNLQKFFASKTSEFVALTFCHPNSHPFDSDLLVLSDSGLVERVFRPSRSGDLYYRNVVNAALYVMDKRAFTGHVPRSGQMDISSELFPALIEGGESVAAYPSPEYIKDMGTPERLREVSQQVAAGVPGRLSDTGVRKCVFVDRDGVINEDVGHLRNIDDFRILDGVPLAIKRLNNAGYLVICVTNQPVVARGELEERDLAVIHMKLEAELGKEGAYLDGLYYCPHHPDAGFPGEVPELKIICDCRKPAPGMLQLACDDYGIDASSSWMIGDHERDIKAGASAGMNTILIYDESTVIEHSVEIADHQCDDLLSAVEWILSESSASSDQGR